MPIKTKTTVREEPVMVELENNPRTSYKGIATLVGTLLSIFLAILIAEKGYSVYKTFSNLKPDNVMSVSAEGKVKAVPDTATVNLGVLTQATTAEKAQESNTQKINKIISFIKGEGVPETDIQTADYNIYPSYDNKSVITGYQVSQSVRVSVKGIDGDNKEKLEKILAGVTTNGVNQINGVSMSFDDPDELRQQAREQAIEKAKQKAEELAAASGLKLGKILSVSESGIGGVIPYAKDGYGGASNMAMAERSMAAPSFEPGLQDVTATMTVTFEVK